MREHQYEWNLVKRLLIKKKNQQAFPLPSLPFVQQTTLNENFEQKIRFFPPILILGPNPPRALHSGQLRSLRQLLTSKKKTAEDGNARFTGWWQSSSKFHVTQMLILMIRILYLWNIQNIVPSPFFWWGICLSCLDTLIQQPKDFRGKCTKSAKSATKNRKVCLAFPTIELKVTGSKLLKRQLSIPAVS